MSERTSRRPVSLFAGLSFYLLACIGLWLTSLFGEILVPYGTEEQQSLMINLLYYLPFIFLPVSLWAGGRKDCASVMRLKGLRPSSALWTIIIALFTVLTAQRVSVIWMTLCQKMGLNVFTSSYVRPSDTSELIISLVSTAIVAPICEEMLFRGVMLSAFEDRRGAQRAVSVTAILFAILHGSILGLPAELVGGLTLGILVIGYDSLYSGMLFHAVYNAAVVLINYASQSSSESYDLLESVGGLGGMFVYMLLTLACIFILYRALRVPLDQKAKRDMEKKMLAAARMEMMSLAVPDEPAEEGSEEIASEEIYAEENPSENDIAAPEEASSEDDESDLPGEIPSGPDFEPDTLFGEKDGRMDTGEVIVLMAGVVSCIAMLMLNLITLL